MRRTLQWTKWSDWKSYGSATNQYRTRNSKLMCGQILVATLVESDVPRYGSGQRCFMYAGRVVVKGVNPFRTVRAFVRRYL